MHFGMYSFVYDKQRQQYIITLYIVHNIGSSQ